MNSKRDLLEDKKKNRRCRICKGRKALIRKYRLYVCRRCFKEFATELGFRKYD